MPHCLDSLRQLHSSTTWSISNCLCCYACFDSLRQWLSSSSTCGHCITARPATPDSSGSAAFVTAVAQQEHVVNALLPLPLPPLPQTLLATAGWGGTQRLVRAVGKSKAMQMVLTGSRLDAHQAERDGKLAPLPTAAPCDHVLILEQTPVRVLRLVRSTAGNIQLKPKRFSICAFRYFSFRVFVVPCCFLYVCVLYMVGISCFVCVFAVGRTRVFLRTYLTYVPVCPKKEGMFLY